MPAFDQLGDPVCPDCLCEHHEAAYAERVAQTTGALRTPNYDLIDANAQVASVDITTTETCCIVVNAAIITDDTVPATSFEIERPLGTIITEQEDEVPSNEFTLLHHAGWEVLPAGTYTFYLMNRAVGVRVIFGTWIKAVASDCLG